MAPGQSDLQAVLGSEATQGGESLVEGSHGKGHCRQGILWDKGIMGSLGEEGSREAEVGGEEYTLWEVPGLGHTGL